MKNDDREDRIEGRNAVTEAIRAGRAIDKLYIAKGEIDKTLRFLASSAKDAGIAVVEADRRKLDVMSTTGAHQGVIAVAAVREYASLDDIFALAKERGEDPFIVACDEITDPHNLGAILRTAEAAGVHGVIITKRRSAGLTSIVGKASAGAAEHVPVCRIPNLPSAIDSLKEAGLWVFGADASGDRSLWESDFTGPVCLVIGSEGDGIGRLVREKCDFLVSIPMRGKISSLNASAAAAVMLYEALRQKNVQSGQN